MVRPFDANFEMSPDDLGDLTSGPLDQCYCATTNGQGDTKPPPSATSDTDPVLNPSNSRPDIVDMALGVLAYRLQVGLPQAERALMEWTNLTGLSIAVLSGFILDAVSTTRTHAEPVQGTSVDDSTQTVACQDAVPSIPADTFTMDGPWLDQLSETLVKASGPKDRALILLNIVVEASDITTQLLTHNESLPPASDLPIAIPGEAKCLQAMVMKAQEHALRMMQMERPTN